MEWNLLFQHRNLIFGGWLMLQTYRDLEVWKKSIDLVESTYQLTKSFPAEEKFGLIRFC